MEKVKIPQIVIDGKAIYPHTPKMKVWRKFLAFQDTDKTDMGIEDLIDAYADLIVLAFDKSEVTKETVDDNLPICEVIPLTREIYAWLQWQVLSKLEQLPNDEPRVEEQT